VPIREDLAKALHRCGAVKFGAFKLKLHEKQPDAPLSPIYLNLRTPENKGGPLTPKLVDQIGEVLYSTSCRDSLRYHHIAGLPVAGDPFASALHCIVARRDVGLLKLIKTEADGARSITGIREGGFAKGEHVLIVDDLVTKAETKLEGIRVLESNGLVVKDILVLVDREQGGSEELAKAGYTVHCAYTLSDLLEIYVSSLDLAPSKRDEVLEYIVANS